MLGKKKNNALFSEVSDSRKLVFDFRRRTQLLFENYRSVGYKKEAAYNLEQMKEEDAEVLARLIASHAADAGNDDCLVEKILGPVRAGICYLDDQSLEHMDFYSRQGANMKAHSADIGRLLEFWRSKEASMAKEHEHTQCLWNRYCGYSEKEN